MQRHCYLMFNVWDSPYFFSLSCISWYHLLSFGKPACISGRRSDGGGWKYIGPLPSATSFSMPMANCTGKNTPAGPVFGKYFLGKFSPKAFTRKSNPPYRRQFPETPCGHKDCRIRRFSFGPGPVRGCNPVSRARTRNA